MERTPQPGRSGPTSLRVSRGFLRSWKTKNNVGLCWEQPGHGDGADFKEAEHARGSRSPRPALWANDFSRNESVTVCCCRGHRLRDSKTARATPALGADFQHRRLRSSASHLFLLKTFFFSFFWKTRVQHVLGSLEGKSSPPAEECASLPP